MISKEAMIKKNIRDYISIDESSPSGLGWILSPARAVKAGDVALGSVNTSGYCVGIFDRKRILAHRAVWFLHYGEWPKECIDHINGITTDNRIENLRDVSRSVNQKNRRMSSNNTTGVNGVWVNKTSGKYRASIRTTNGRIYLGSFDSVNEAGLAIKNAMDADGNFTIRHGKA